MKAYEVEVIAKITVYADGALQAKECAVRLAKERADEAAWLTCAAIIILIAGIPVVIAMAALVTLWRWLGI